MKKLLYYLGAVFLQSIVIFAIYFIMTLFIAGMFASIGNPNSGRFYMSFLSLILFMLASLIGSAVYVFFNSRKKVIQGFDTLIPPVAWAFVTFFVWYPGIAFYFFLRKFYFKKEEKQTLF